MGYAFILLFAFWSLVGAAHNLFTLRATDLTERSIAVSGDATYYRQDCDCVQLTASSFGYQPTNSTGRIVYRNPIRFRDGSHIASFSTSFTFKIEQFLEPDPRFRPGAGMAFMIVPKRYKDSPANGFGQYMGLMNESLKGSPLLAVEFDNVQNADFNDPPYNHIGVDLNSLMSVSLFNITQGYSDLNLTSNFTLTAWVEYQAEPDVLEVRMARNLSRPANALLRTNLSSSKTKMSEVLEEFMYVGFSAATGADCFEFHKILAWNFSTSGISECSKWTCTWRLPLVVVVLGFTGLVVAAVLLFIWYRKQADGDEDLSEIFSNTITRFSYKELRSATWGFSKRDLIGVGGFSKVYKATLKDGSMVAVKVLDRTKATSGTGTATTSDTSHTDHSLEQFANEMSIVGRLRHRHLVGLRGFCHDRKKLMLVYEYMPRGSLEKVLFSSSSTLDWEQRLSVIKGVAEGLAFLHEGWEQRVIHRDVKAANVLLDNDLNAKLGDFGFCKLMDHSSAAQTMTAVGTRGYIAPELVYTGKATEKTDVYSYGVLLLEVVSGSRAVNYSKNEDDRVLLDWVWRMNEEDRLLEVIDTKLNVSGEAEVMAKRVLWLGLSCCHPDPLSRPTMRRCCQFLETGSSLPLEVPSTRPVAVFGSSMSTISTPFLSTTSSEVMSGGPL